MSSPPTPPKCPHGCRPTKSLQWVDDQWYCPKCGDEWDDDLFNDPAEAGLGGDPQTGNT